MPSRLASWISSLVTGMYSSVVRMWMVTSSAPRRSDTRAQSSEVKPAPTTATRRPTVLGTPRCNSMRKSRPYSAFGIWRTGSGPVSSTPRSGRCCATAWPPVPGDATVDAALGLDVTVIERADGSSQLVVGRWPAYTFSGDAAPGDVNGQGSGGAWFALAPDGSLIR